MDQGEVSGLSWQWWFTTIETVKGLSIKRELAKEIPNVMRNIRVINVSNRCRLYFAVGVASLWAIAYATSSAGYPTLLAPQSVVIVLPLLVLCDFYRETPCTLLVGTFMLPLLFFAWSFKLLNGQVKIPMRSKIGTVLLMLLSAIWLVFHSSLGVQYQGTIHTFMVCGCDCVW